MTSESWHHDQVVQVLYGNWNRFAEEIKPDKRQLLFIHLQDLHNSNLAYEVTWDVMDTTNVEDNLWLWAAVREAERLESKGSSLIVSVFWATTGNVQSYLWNSAATLLDLKKQDKFAWDESKESTSLNLFEDALCRHWTVLGKYETAPSGKPPLNIVRCSLDNIEAANTCDAFLSVYFQAHKNPTSQQIKNFPISKDALIWLVVTVQDEQKKEDPGRTYRKFCGFALISFHTEHINPKTCSPMLVVARVHWAFLPPSYPTPGMKATCEAAWKSIWKDLESDFGVTRIEMDKNNEYPDFYKRQQLVPFLRLLS